MKFCEERKEEEQFSSRRQTPAHKITDKSASDLRVGWELEAEKFSTNVGRFKRAFFSSQSEPRRFELLTGATNSSNL